jgi:hypothetical protein
MTSISYNYYFYLITELFHNHHFSSLINEFRYTFKPDFSVTLSSLSKIMYFPVS